MRRGERRNGVGAGGRGRCAGLAGQKREIHHLERLQPDQACPAAYQCKLEVAAPRLLRQNRCSIASPVPLCIRYSQGQPEGPLHCKRRPLYRSNSLQMFVT